MKAEIYPLSTSQIAMLQRAVRDDGFMLTPTQIPDAERLDDLCLCGLEWEEGTAEIYPYESGHVVAATLNAPLYRERESLATPQNGEDE